MSTQTLRSSRALALTSITLLRVATLIVGAAMVGLGSIGIGILYTRLQQVCSAPLDVCALTMQLMPSNLAGVDDPDSALLFHAVWRAGLNAIVRGTCWTLALLILRYRSRDLMGLITALWLFTYGAPFDLFATATAYPFLLWPVRMLFGLNTLCFGLFLTLFPQGWFQPRWSIGIALLWLLYAVMDLFPALSLLLTQADQYRALAFTAVLNTSTALLHIYRYRKLSNVTERQQTKWVLFGVLVWLVVSLLTRWIVAATYMPTAPITPMFYLSGIGFPLAALALPVAVGIAILRHGLFDIDLILNRTLVYGALTAFVIGAYTLIVVVVGARLRVQGDVVLSLVATGVVAITFNPLRERLQRGVNRLLYGQRDEPYAVVAQLGKQLASPATHAPADLLQAIAQTIGQTLKLPYVAIETAAEPRWTTDYNEPISKRRGRLSENLVAFPLTYQGEALGMLHVAPRAGENLSIADRKLLHELALQVGIAVHAAQVTVELQRSRERIVTAREEERRRIRRDLHDGLGPQLASQSLKLETAHDFIPNQPERACAVLKDLLAQSQKMVGEIRQLVYALRPPALDDFGLLGALRDVVARSAPPTLHVEIVAPDVLPPLPAAVEVAAYRIVQEAITNVVKHAQATRCAVHIKFVTQRVEHDTFMMEICDDGVGIRPDVPHGIGMHSMRERAEELGGALKIDSNQPYGTLVHVELPVVH